MTTQELKNVTEPEEYRGSLVYTQEYGYKLVTMTVSVAPNEQSHVTIHAYNLPLDEDAERLQSVDLYHFSVTNGTRIQLTIDTLAGTRDAWYTVEPETIKAEPSHIDMDVIRSDESIPFEYAYTQEALDEALTHYADLIRNFLQAS